MIRIKLPFQIKIYLLLFLLFALLMQFTIYQVNNLVTNNIIQYNTRKFEELRSIFHNLLDYRIQSIENEASLLADQDALRNALEQMGEGANEKPYLAQWLPGAGNRELTVITDSTGRVIDGSITLVHGDKTSLIQDSLKLQSILDSWKRMNNVLMGHDNIGYIVVSSEKGKSLFAVASAPIINPQRGNKILGSVSVGFPVDQTLAKDLLRGSSFHIGFILDDKIVTSTFGLKQSIDFSSEWYDTAVDKRNAMLNRAEIFRLFNERYLAYSAPLPTQSESRGLYVILSPLEDIFRMLDDLNSSIIQISLFIFFAVLLIGYILARNVTAPVAVLAQIVSHISKGDYDIKPSIHTGDELETLGKQIHNMASTIKRRNEEIQDYIGQIEDWNKELESKVNERTQDLEEKNFRLRMISEELGRAYARIDDELKVVGALQKRLLPNRSFEKEGLTIRSVYIPNGRSGGDYYDYLSPEHNQLYILMADVSGHGTPAAFIMGITRAMSHTLIEQNLSPKDLLTQLNNVLLNTLHSGEFVTMFLGKLDLATSKFEYASAGHQPPLLARQKSKPVEELEVSHGLPLGILPDTEYDQVSTSIQPGDRLLMYTDGIIEAFNDEKKPYGINRLIDMMENNGDISADDLLETILDDLEEFVQHPLDIEPLDDDVTLLMIDFDHIGSNEY